MTGAMRRSRAPADPGFSLLEVLVAFVILSLVATALFRLFSGALVNASAADDYTHAVLVAESALTEASATVPLVETTNSGSALHRRISPVSRHGRSASRYRCRICATPMQA